MAAALQVASPIQPSLRGRSPAWFTREVAVAVSSGVRSVVLSCCALALTCARASAQPAAAPPAPAGPWIGSAGAGLAITSGNSDTSNINASYDVTYDPKTNNVVKSDALYLRGKSAGNLTVNRLGFDARDQYQLTGRTFVYGQFQFLRDTFKEIDYLVSPTVGIGYKLIDAPETKLAVDAGVGGVWEKDPGLGVQTSGAITAGEHFTQKLSEVATFTQQVTGLWKTSDTSDALYTFGAALAATLTAKSQVRVEVLDTYKGKPPSPAIKKNDIATVFSIGYKF
jgi:putative salt-induced outer membrane protein YdiY